MALCNHLPHIFSFFKYDLNQHWFILILIRNGVSEYFEELGVSAVDVFLGFLLHSFELHSHQTFGRAFNRHLIQSFCFTHLQHKSFLISLDFLWSKVMMVLVYLILQLSKDPPEMVQLQRWKFQGWSILLSILLRSGGSNWPGFIQSPLYVFNQQGVIVVKELVVSWFDSKYFVIAITCYTTRSAHIFIPIFFLKY